MVELVDQKIIHFSNVLRMIDLHAYAIYPHTIKSHNNKMVAKKKKKKKKKDALAKIPKL